MQLRDRIKILREEKGFSQAQLAKEVKVNQSTVSYWEKGRQEPNREQRKKLCNIFGITLSEFFKDVDL